MEKVPKNKKFKASTKENSEYKWQQQHLSKYKNHVVVGAYEIHSEPDLNFRYPLKAKNITVIDENNDSAKIKVFQRIQKDFYKSRLHERFIKGCESIPVEASCCGMVPHDKANKKNLVVGLNQYWVKEINQFVEDSDQIENKFKIDLYKWSWTSIAGKGDNEVLLIRFFAQDAGTFRPTMEDIQEDEEEKQL